MSPRPLILNAFLTQNLSHIHHGKWRDPSSRNVDFNDLSAWTELVEALEHGGFDAIFFADVLGFGDDTAGGWREAARYGVQFPAGDPAALVPALVARTSELNFVLTSSILKEHPFVFARYIATLDHLSGGRIGWNVVTSSRRTEARAVGLAEISPHAERYAMAEEYLEVVYALLETSWEEGAIIADRASGEYLDDRKLHEIHHRGAHWTVDAVQQQAPSPQRTPVLFQAGGSPVGRDFAARHAEGTFIAGHDPASAARVIGETRALLAKHGRRADDLRFIQGLSFVVGSTDEEAQRLSTDIDDELVEQAMLIHMSSTIGIDFTSIDLDQPVEGFQSRRVQGAVQGLLDSAPGKPKTFRELARWAWSQRVVGGPETIADRVAEWARAGVDGLNIIHVTTPGSYLDFVDQVLPVLRERGLARRGRRSGTFREQLFPGRGPRLPERHPARRQGR
ncbi:NtaA/DmoA family FMN-dependent monooxygenase [Leucobacter weissii]|uniref:NtaA/DmoA family FMN-dependent monooxygenase n=1 Tax=Leucobacter weissii TaxID=1983706 RepID=A0A939MHE0_9MICO|nr:NtaA/DmoA family FMN-dependent monooxygenase [Leucobacter weissii]MBO1900963.1 NtaA/DmoA family FMN-dependent monooxygenase [Leucobacter weissii]